MDLKSFSEKDDANAPYRKKETSRYETEKTMEEERLKKGMDETDVREAIGHYSKMSNDQLMSELVKHVGAQKASGKSASMKETIEKIKPFLNAEQRKRLESIIGQLDI